MKTINVDLSSGEALNLLVGRQGESGVTQVVFDFSALKTEFGTGTVSLSVKRPKEPTPYAQTITTSGTNATWLVNETDTGVAGCGEIQLTYTVNSQIAKTVVYKYTVYPSIGVDGEYPIPGQTWQQEIEEDIREIKEDLAELEGGGLSDDAKAALLACFRHIAFLDDDDDYYQDLYDALYPPAPPATLVSISCVYTQSGTVYDTDTLDSLKSDLVVTAHYDNGTTQTVTAYTLSGTLTAGTSTITVSYNGKTTTFTVTVTHASAKVYFNNAQYEDDTVMSSTGETSSNTSWILVTVPNVEGVQIHTQYNSSQVNQRPPIIIKTGDTYAKYSSYTATQDSGSYYWADATITGIDETATIYVNCLQRDMNNCYYQS